MKVIKHGILLGEVTKVKECKWNVASHFSTKSFPYETSQRFWLGDYDVEEL
jgi:hypothetical protein